ncbi:MAG: hypothetical protein ABIF06_00190 [bacterium]
MLTRLFALFDRTISALFRLPSSSWTGPGGFVRNACYFEFFGPRFIIFRKGKVHAIGGMFEILHRYSLGGKLLSRQLRFKAEFEPGDALFFGRSPHCEAVGAPGPPECEFLNF